MSRRLLTNAVPLKQTAFEHVAFVRDDNGGAPSPPAHPMTSIAFVMGVAPLITAIGPGAEMRHAMGEAVFFGMIGVTVLGLVLTPVFYVAMTGGRKPLAVVQLPAAAAPSAAG